MTQSKKFLGVGRITNKPQLIVTSSCKKTVWEFFKNCYNTILPGKSDEMVKRRYYGYFMLVRNEKKDVVKCYFYGIETKPRFQIFYKLLMHSFL